MSNGIVKQVATNRYIIAIRETVYMLQPCSNLRVILMSYTIYILLLAIQLVIANGKKP